MLDSYIEQLINMWGFETVVMIKDFIILFTGFLIGMFLVLLIFSKIVTQIEKGEKFEHVTVIEIEHAGKRHIGINPKNIAEGLDAIVSFLVIMVYKNKKYKLKNKKRSQVLIAVTISLTLASMFISFYLITHILPLPNQ